MEGATEYMAAAYPQTAIFIDSRESVEDMSDPVNLKLGGREAFVDSPGGIIDGIYRSHSVRCMRFGRVLPYTKFHFRSAVNEIR